MAKDLKRRNFLRASGAALTTAVIAGCAGNGNGNGGNGNGSGDTDTFPNDTLTAVNHFSEGGGLDNNFREVQPHWEDELDGTFQQQYQPGAGTRNGMSFMLNNADTDMHTIGITDAVSMASARAFDLEDDTRDPVYEPDDFAFLGTLTSEVTILRIREDEDRFTTFGEFVDYAQDNPDDVVMGTSGPTNRFALAGIQLLEEIGVDMRIVPYDGGSPVQTALLQGEVDVIPRGVYNSRGIEDDSIAIAMYWDENNWPEITNDAPLINEELGSDIPYEPSVGANVYYTQAEAAENHPDRYDTMVETFQAAASSDGYLSDLDEIDEFERDKVDPLGPDGARQFVEETIDTYRDFVPLFQEYVEN